jgi:hypothetical protein
MLERKLGNITNLKEVYDGQQDFSQPRCSLFPDDL